MCIRSDLRLRYPGAQNLVARLPLNSPIGSWKEAPITSVGDNLEKDRLEYLANSRAQQVTELQDKVERLLDWSNGGDAGVALPSLIKIVGDDTASVRQRLRASACVLAYKADNEATAFVRKFLESVCANADGPNIDYRIEAGELLRKHEAPRVVSESVKPSYRESEPEKPVIPLRELVRQRRERADRMEAEMIRQYRPPSPGRRYGNGSDDAPAD